MDATEIGSAVIWSTQIEKILVDDFAAEGRGLHEKISSVEPRLPNGLVRRLRWIATIRNNVVHSHGSIPPDYFPACEESLTQLQALMGGHDRRGVAQEKTSETAVRRAPTFQVRHVPAVYRKRFPRKFPIIAAAVGLGIALGLAYLFIFSGPSQKDLALRALQEGYINGIASDGAVGEELERCDSFLNRWPMSDESHMVAVYRKWLLQSKATGQIVVQPVSFHNEAWISSPPMSLHVIVAGKEVGYFGSPKVAKNVSLTDRNPILIGWGTGDIQLVFGADGKTGSQNIVGSLSDLHKQETRIVTDGDTDYSCTVITDLTGFQGYAPKLR
jgi:hypothetical protein